METTSMPSISNEEEFPWKTPETTFRHAADTREVKVPGFFSHYKLLLWKTFVLRKRQPWVIVSELVLPLVLVIAVVALRFTEVPEVYPPCYLVSQPLPSMGFLAYMRSIVCNFNFSCSSHDVDDQSRANLFPSWMQLIAKQPPQMLDSALNLISSLAMEDEKESTDPVVTLIDILCKPEVAVLLRSSPHSDRVYYLEKLCKAPNFIKVLSLTTVVEEVAQSLGTLVPDKKALRQNSGTQGLNVSLLVEQVRKGSILLCGSHVGSNSYLEALDFLRGTLSSLGMSTKGITQDLTQNTTHNESKPQTACSVLNSIFRFDTARPWTSRLRAAMQSEVYFFPNTTMTKEIVEKANTTAVMFSRLRAIVEEWMTQKDALVPHVFVNSSLAKAVRLAANICRINQNLSPDVREKCRRVVSFLGKTPSGNDTHWTDLVPSIDLVSNAIHDVLQNCITYDRFRGFDNQTVMFEALEQATKDGKRVFAIEFEESPKMLSMQFRFPPYMIDSTRGFKVLDNYWSPDPRYRTSNSMKYFTSGFIDLQDQVERAYVAILSQITTPKDPYANDFLPTEMQFVPGPCYQVDSMLRIFVVNIPLMVVVIWLCNYVINVRAVVYEKELHLKEFTKVMGMGNSVHWLNWFTVGFIMMGCSSVVVTILLKYGQVLPRTEGFLLFCCFIAYILAILPQAFLTTVFFNNANFGAIFSGIIYFIFYIPYNLTLIYDLGFVPLLVLSFLPQCTIAMTFSRLMSFEVQGIGGQWKTLWLNDLSNDSFSVGLCLLMLLVDGALAWIGIWYLENVVSGSLGFSRKWYFPFTKSYWLEVFKHSFRPKEAEGLQPQPADVDPGFHEVASKSLSVGVSVRGLTKYYGRKRVAALDNLWVDFYENQITAFLGHNGAGKTTTISILTGISAASAGTAYVYGKDINTGMPAIRHHLGLCPQHNVLFSNMSVAEHIRFYGYLKGLSRAEVDAEVGHFLVELGLKEKANDRVKTLSGGQKRQLSLAAAFVGGSKIVFLDEPTAGVDPASRRSIWNFIFRFKHSRTIILTTHHMDEADILGDRIAIVSQGHLKASGSSLFLKSKFAKNYYLNVEKAGNGGVDYTADAKLTERVAAHLPGSELAVSTPTEWIFTLPATRAYDADGFVKLFTYLEANKSTLSEEFGVNQIGLTDTSLEEIFILLSDDPSKVEPMSNQSRRKLTFMRNLFSHGDRHRTQLNGSQSPIFQDVDEDAKEGVEVTKSESVDNSEEVDFEKVFANPGGAATTDRHRGLKLYSQQCRAYLIKRLHYVQRSKRGWFLEVVVPVLSIVVLLVVIANYPVDMTQPSMPLHPWLMANKNNVPHLQTFFANSPTQNPSISQVSQLYSSEIASARGWSGTRCLPKSVYELRPGKFDFCNLEDYTMPNPLPALSEAGILEVKASENISCSCDSGEILCPQGSIVEPPRHLLPSTDYLMNLTHYNVSNFLLKTRNEAILKRYGGLNFLVSDNPEKIVATKEFLSNRTRLEALLNSTLSSPELTSIGTKLGSFLSDSLPPTHYARIWYHNKGYPSSTAYLNVFHNLQLRMFLAKNNIYPDPENYGLAIANFPLPTGQGQTTRRLLNSLMIELTKAIGVIFALSFVSSSFTTFIIREKHSGAMAMQFLSGHSRLVYWSMSYVWDFISFLIPVAFIVIIFVIFDEQAYIGKGQIGAFIVLLVVYGLAITPLMYCFSFIFHSPSVAFVSFLALNILVTIITTVIVQTLELTAHDNPDVSSVADVLANLFLIFPQFAFSRGFYELAKGYAINALRLDQLTDSSHLFSWKALTEKLVAMTIEAVVFSGILLLVEYSRLRNVCGKCKNKSKIVSAAVSSGEHRLGIGADVLEERERVENDPNNSTRDVVRVVNLSKQFSKRKVPAVNDLTFGVRLGECFGLLGVNGAGKSTTFNMLTTNIRPSMGTISIDGIDVFSNPNLHEVIAYCPQFNPLHTHLTGFETLQLYARIRGYPESTISSVADRLIDQLCLRPHAKKPVYAYSGGNLRKLSIAVAIIGHPKVLLLDEPTAGMDPGAKRCLWDVIKAFLRENRSVVLTSHSMEECEALCNRLAIMMEGQFQCFGTAPHLKELFGEGYIVEVDLVHEEHDPQSLFPSHAGIKLTDVVGRRCNFETHKEVPLSEVFKQLVALRTAGRIMNFAVRQSSLDSVFVNFVRRYENDKANEEYYGSEDLSFTEQEETFVKL